MKSTVEGAGPLVPVARGLVGDLVADLVREHGYDLVKGAIDRFRSKPAPSSGAVLLVGLAIALGSRSRRRRR